jgi:hypothetical protein
VNRFLLEHFGDPCRGCGSRWDLGVDDVLGIVASSAVQVQALVSSATGDERGDDLHGDVTSYVLHLADNQRTWAG